MIKEIPKYNYQQSNPSNFKELAGQPNQFIGNYPVQNQIFARRWMNMNWYLLASTQVSLLA